MPPTTKKKLAIFDLDETLVHCFTSKLITEKDYKPSDTQIEFKLNDVQIYASLNIRPYVQECLRELK